MSKIGKILDISKEIAERYKAGESTVVIARDIGTYPTYVNQALIKEKVSRRSFVNDIVVSEQLRQMIDGWLLGDGNLTFTGRQAHFQFSSKYNEYIQFVKQALEEEGVLCKTYEVIDKKYKTKAYKLKSFGTLQFGRLYQRWYPNDKKIVPDDLVLTNLVIKNWIMDDGTLDKKKGHMRLCTCSFSVDECKVLAQKLSDYIGMEKSSWVIEISSGYPRIYIPRKYTNILLNKIGECEVSSFQYKWGIASGGDLSSV